VQVYRKYAPRGVVFIGLSVANQEQAEAFVRAFGLPWVNGYGAEDTIKQLGAPPTLFVIDRSGHVAWNDARSRSWHNNDEAQAELQEVLDSLLDDESATPPTPP
jgi:peroxiredoxin